MGPAPEDWQELTETAARSLLGEGPYARIISRIAGRIVYTKTGGKRRSNKRKTKDTHGPAVKVAEGVEYYPPKKAKS